MQSTTHRGASTRRSISSATPGRIVLWIIYLVSIAMILWFVADGWSYYRTPFPDRVHHAEYRELRPAGSLGLLYGYAGSAMMILMLVYSVRKRTRLLGQRLSLQSLLQFHIYLGIMGPLLIVLHTSFKVQGLVAVSFWSMVAVAASGFFGRYLYAQIPRNIQGTELSLPELGRLSAESLAQLRAQFALDDSLTAKLESVISRFAETSSDHPLRAAFSLVLERVIRPVSRNRFRRQIMRAVPLPKHELDEFTDRAFARALLERRINRLGQVQRVFHYWHVVHKPFAIIMYLIMLIHIGVAIWTGYGWIS